MNEQLFTNILDLLAEAEISYTANGHSYEPEIIDELRSISDRVSNLYNKLKEAYVIIETKKILEDALLFQIREVTKLHETVTVKELFDELDDGEFICPGGPLINNVSYQNLKEIFKIRPSLTIEEATQRIGMPM
jgi:hypothetical protein